MRIFQRIGAPATLALASLLTSCDQPQPSTPTPATPTKTTAITPQKKTAAPASPLSIGNTTIRRERDHTYLAEIDFSFDNQSAEKISTAQSANLITDTGRTVPVFFLAFTGVPPELPAGQTTEATIRFSLLPQDIVGSLTLEIDDHSVPVKSSRSFDPEAIAQNRSQSFDDLDW